MSETAGIDSFRPQSGNHSSLSAAVVSQKSLKADVREAADAMSMEDSGWKIKAAHGSASSAADTQAVQQAAEVGNVDDLAVTIRPKHPMSTQQLRDDTSVHASAMDRRLHDIYQHAQGRDSSDAERLRRILPLEELQDGSEEWMEDLYKHYNQVCI